MKPRVLDLFSGVGGFSLGLRRAGAQTVAFCEIDPFCRRVLAKHWPGVPCYDDIRTLTAARLAADNIWPNVLCGGFPCQDLSLAGAGAGLSGARSGLWFEFARVIGEFHPYCAIIENVPALRSRGLDQVLRSLAAIGYDAEWHCIPAAAIGAPHRRDRIWIVAYPHGEPEQQPSVSNHASVLRDRTPRLDAGGRGELLAYSYGDDGGQGRPGRSVADGPGQPQSQWPLRDSNGAGLAFGQSERDYPRPKLTTVERTDGWLAEPDFCRVAPRVPNGVDRIKSLGNSIVPEIAYQIGRALFATIAAPGSGGEG